MVICGSGDTIACRALFGTLAGELALFQLVFKCMRDLPSADLACCRLFNASAERVMWRLRSRLFEHIIHQEVGFFDRVRTGELMNRLSEVRSLKGYILLSLRSIRLL